VPESHPILRARGLVKDYRRARAVDGIDLDVRPGERVALLGPNGAGKTTTLLMVLGVVTPDSGWVEVGGLHTRQRRVSFHEKVNVVRVDARVARYRRHWTLAPYRSLCVQPAFRTHLRKARSCSSCRDK